MSKLYVSVLNYKNHSIKQFCIEFDNESDFNVEDWLIDNVDITGYNESDCYWISTLEPLIIDNIINVKVKL